MASSRGRVGPGFAGRLARASWRYTPSAWSMDGRRAGTRAANELLAAVDCSPPSRLGAARDGPYQRLMWVRIAARGGVATRHDRHHAHIHSLLSVTRHVAPRALRTGLLPSFMAGKSHRAPFLPSVKAPAGWEEQHSRRTLAPQSIPFAARVRCLGALGAVRRRTALRPELLAAGPASTHPTPQKQPARAGIGPGGAGASRAPTRAPPSRPSESLPGAAGHARIRRDSGSARVSV